MNQERFDSAQKSAKCETCEDTGYYGDNQAGKSGNSEYVECDQCDFWQQPFHTTVYPDFDDNNKNILYYAEFFKLADKVKCKVYKRTWMGTFSESEYISSDFVRKLFNKELELHPYVLMEFQLNENTEPRAETVRFMIDAMNEKMEQNKTSKGI